MLFYASKLIWRILGPSHILVWSGLLAVMLLVAGRRRAGTIFSALTAAILIGIGVIPSYHWLGRSLEAPYDHVVLPAHVDGILVLGGGGTENPRRLPSAYMLAQRYPTARIVYSGGDGAIYDKRSDDQATAARDYLLALGLDPKRLTVEARSRNTQENLLFSKALISPRPDEVWILVSSAYHLPRAMKMAEDVDWKPIAWPSYHYTYASGPTGWFEVPHNIEAFDTILHERVGLWAHSALVK